MDFSRLFGVILVFSFVGGEIHGEQSRSAEKTLVNDPAGKIWDSMLGFGSIEPGLIAGCQSDKKCIGALIECWKRAGPNEKKETISKFVRLGGQISGQGGDASNRIGPYLIEESIVGLMAEATGNADAGIREQAVEILVKETPDGLVRKHAFAIESTLMRYPGIENGLLLLGKLGNENAIKRIARKGEPQLANPKDVQAAFGKLGRKRSEDSLVAEYERETDQSKKLELAWYLGYMATPKSLHQLVRDLRTPSYYLWNGGNGIRSFRVHIIQALSMAFPREPLLWSSFYDKPSDDRFYEGVENWAIRELGAKWDHPRPPFLWEAVGPYPLPAWRDQPFTSGKP